MEIKNWIHAIDLTIERHQAVLDGKFKDYVTAKIETSEKGWESGCPLCVYSTQDNRKNSKSNSCDNCPWVIFTKTTCLSHNTEYNRRDKESIDRLNKWKELLK